MESFRKKVSLRDRFLLSSALGWLVIYPYVILPQLGTSEYSLPQLASLMLVGFIITLVVLGATIRSIREFVILAAASGLLIKIYELLSALIFPYAARNVFTSPLEYWTLGLIFSIFFCAIFMLIGLPFGWLVGRFRKPELK